MSIDKLIATELLTFPIELKYYFPLDDVSYGVRMDKQRGTEQRMPYGKYLGKSLSQIPTEYLNWLVDNGDQQSPLVMDAMRIVWQRTVNRNKRSAPR